MKNHLLCIFAYLFLFPTVKAQYVGDNIFNQNIVHEINIYSEKDDLIDDLYQLWLIENQEEKKTYIKVNIEIDKLWIDNVGIRVKGGISGFDTKKPLKIDFNRFEESHSYDGLNKINLHQGSLDSSYLGEVLSYNILRFSGVKASRTSPAKVFLNDQYLGLYTLVEQIDKSFIKSNFASGKGLLVKRYGNNKKIVKSGIGTANDLEEIIEDMLTIPSSVLHLEIDKYLNVNSFLRFMACEVLISATDDILDIDKEYYLYLEPKSGLLHFIPWDLNLSFFNQKHNLIPRTGNKLFQHILNNDSLKGKYLAIMCEILLNNYTEDRLFDIINDYLKLIKDAVKYDPHKNKIVGVDRVKNRIRERIATISQQLDESDTFCEHDTSIDKLLVINEIMASNDSTSEISDPDGGYPDWIELYNGSNQDIALNNYFLSHDKDFLKFWAFGKNDTIKANGYFILWADKDLDEMGTHLNFKLNKKKGDLILSHSTDYIVDELSYSNQKTNIALARSPNGRGSFINQAPTIGKSNDLISTSINTKRDKKWSLYPNPTSNHLNISMNQDYIGFGQIKIFNVEGEVLLIHNFFNCNHALETILIDLVDFLPGIYLIQLETMNSLSSKRFFVK